MSENRVTRKISAAGMDKLKGDRKALHNEELLRLVILMKYY